MRVSFHQAPSAAPLSLSEGAPSALRSVGACDAGAPWESRAGAGTRPVEGVMRPRYRRGRPRARGTEGGGLEVEEGHRLIHPVLVDAVEAEPGDHPRRLEAGADVEREVEGGVVDVLGERDVRVVGESLLDVEGAGADLVGEARALAPALGESEEGDLGDGAERIGAGEGDPEGPVVLRDFAEVADNLGALLLGEGRGREDRAVRGDAGALEVAEPEAEVGELGDPGLGDGDDDSEPVLVGGALGEEHLPPGVGEGPRPAGSPSYVARAPWQGVPCMLTLSSARFSGFEPRA